MICPDPVFVVPTAQWVAVPVLVLVRIGNVMAPFGEALAYRDETVVVIVHPTLAAVLRS
jgi:hypothetical protein